MPRVGMAFQGTHTYNQHGHDERAHLAYLEDHFKETHQHVGPTVTISHASPCLQSSVSEDARSTLISPSMSRRRLQANIPVLQSKLSLPPPAAHWECSSPISPGGHGPILPIARRWPLSSLKGPNSEFDSAPVTPVEQIAHTPDEPPVMRQSPQQRPSLLRPFGAPQQLDYSALSPLAYPGCTPPTLSPMVEEPPCFDRAIPALACETCVRRLPSAAVSVPSRPLYGRHKSSSSLIPVTTAAPRVREQPLRMGLARRLSYNHAPRVFATIGRGSSFEEPLASPLTLGPTQVFLPTTLESVSDDEAGSAQTTPMRTEGSSYFGF